MTKTGLDRLRSPTWVMTPAARWPMDATFRLNRQRVPSITNWAVRGNTKVKVKCLLHIARPQVGWTYRCHHLGDAGASQ